LRCTRIAGAKIVPAFFSPAAFARAALFSPWRWQRPPGQPALPVRFDRFCLAKGKDDCAAEPGITGEKGKGKATPATTH
jgi:hypothetical protein